MAASYETSTTKTPKKQKIRTVVRNEVEQKWLDSNAIPDKGELVYGSDVNTLKIGDGIHKYEDLPAISGGGSGTTDYTQLSNKPSINDVTLVGNVSIADLGFANVATTGDYNDLTNTPTLGTAAEKNVDYFATAAQGDLADTAVQPGDLATVATSGSYDDLSNKPTIPAAQVNSDWDAVSGIAQILNKPTLGTMAAESASDYTKTSDLATVATSGDYDDLINKPTIPAAQVNSDWNASSGVAEILNKPTLGTMASESANDYTKTSELATVATTGNYDDLINKPVTPTATDQVAGIAKLYNTTGQNTDGSMTQKSITDALALKANSANLATVATSGSYEDLSNKPTIPTVGNGTITITQGGASKGTFTTNQVGNTTIALDAGGGTVDQVYDATSTNAQSGTAVAGAIANKVTRTTVSSGAIVYGENNSGETTFTVTQFANNYALVQRTSAGQITVKLTPTANSDAASKKYVDDSIATKATITLRDWSVNS